MFFMVYFCIWYSVFVILFGVFCISNGVFDSSLQNLV